MKITTWRQYPITLLGYIEGICRLEQTGGIDCYSSSFANRILTFIKLQEWGITHLQKRSKFGFLVQWPLCIHVWYTFRYQQKDFNSNWIPASEKVLYARAGARWDANDACYMIPSFYGGGHWD